MDAMGRSSYPFITIKPHETPLTIQDLFNMPYYPKPKTVIFDEL
jgi:hypothetical protein